MKVRILAALAMIAALATFSTPLLAGEKFAGVEAVTQTLVSKNFAAGKTIIRLTNKGVLMTFDPKHPQNGAAGDCSGSFAVTADGGGQIGAGSCTYVSKDGDVLWLTWQVDAGGGRWQYVGGSGVFENITGNGTFTSAVDANGVVVSRFEGEYQLP